MNNTPQSSAALHLTGNDTYFDDFHIGDVYRHHRAKTVTEVDGVFLCNLVMNTAQGHFNEAQMADTPLGQRIVFGGITAALIVGLASQDTSENAIADLGIDSLTLPHFVFHGDTLSAYTHVVAVEARDREAGVVTFEHWGVNQNDVVVCRLTRRVLIATQPERVTV